MTTQPSDEPIESGLSLAPFVAARYTAGSDQLGTQLSPPYDVISPAERKRLVAASDVNAVRLILPAEEEASLGDGDPYRGAAALLDSWIASGVVTVDPEPALFVYEMTTADGDVTRGLVGAVELRDPADGVILPHENTMAGPVSDRLALMSSTEANLEPIYLVYDGGGAASRLVAAMSDRTPLVETTTPDGVRHRLWAELEPSALADVAADLSTRRALIADGHHRYATYRQLQADHGGAAGPWDRGLTLLVDTSDYGPQVHPIHRVVTLPWQRMLERTQAVAAVRSIDLDGYEAELAGVDGFAVVVTNGDEAVLISELAPAEIEAGLGADASTALGKLDISILHRVLIERVWDLEDTVETVGYAHDVVESLDLARDKAGLAVLVRATPVHAVAEVAAAGARMPRKSTLFTPKPASGVLFRRFADQ